jgi:hypothetical protein
MLLSPHSKGDMAHVQLELRRNETKRNEPELTRQ